MAGSNNDESIIDLLKYIYDTQYDKIIRGIDINLTFNIILYNTGE